MLNACIFHLTLPHENSRSSLNYSPILKSKYVLETREQALRGTVSCFQVLSLKDRQNRDGATGQSSQNERKHDVTA